VLPGGWGTGGRNVLDACVGEEGLLAGRTSYNAATRDQSRREMHKKERGKNSTWNSICKRENREKSSRRGKSPPESCLNPCGKNRGKDCKEKRSLSHVNHGQTPEGKKAWTGEEGGPERVTVVGTTLARERKCCGKGRRAVIG